LDEAGLSVTQPIYRPTSVEEAAQVRDPMLYIANHPNASHLQLVGYLYFFFFLLIQTSSTRQNPRCSSLNQVHTV